MIVAISGLDAPPPPSSSLLCLLPPGVLFTSLAWVTDVRRTEADDVVDANDVRAVEAESVVRERRDEEASGGAEWGSGGKSLFRIAVGGLGLVDILGRRCGVDFVSNFIELVVAILGRIFGGKGGGTGNNATSSSSSCNAGKSRMSIDDIESFIPGDL